jgi:hypothetical protein
MERASAASFTEPLTRTDALYFSVTVFSTVGFGDIGCVLAPVSVLGVWSANQVSDTSRYIANVEPLIHDPAVQNAPQNRRWQISRDHGPPSCIDLKPATHPGIIPAG